ncbi:ExeM/NucH family extracellular endonuclease [Aeromicrobium endophyticum]|uniref:Glutamate--cysteine ligase n=1 Tax=Aeromicrobium endophyticum TaxID=2292704 RepID=A0A371P5Q9_9ACTN|nr:ExeM/NucH family extracellular endonuclease [Aeromicrobium endophyticum]REK70888.1 glutamate--cysteine ligase [Aeromicrobium endophyticum]
MKKSIVIRWAAAAAVSAASLVALPSGPASAAAGGVVINEVYLNGGSSGASYTNKFVELYNPSTDPVDLSGWSVQYKAATSTTITATNIAELGDRTIQPGGTLLVKGASNGAGGQPLPAFDVESTINPSGSAGGVVALARSTSALDSASPTAMLADTDLVDLVGYGTGDTFEKTAEPAGGYGLTASLARAAGGIDTDDNAADFAPLSPPTPLACGEACALDDTPADPVVKTIAEVQGTGTTSPLVGTNVTVEGVVTASYASGGFDGAYIQTEGTGDVDIAGHTASDGVFVSSAAFAKNVTTGDFVSVTGIVSESFGLTQIATPTGGWSVIDGQQHDPVEPATVTFPLTTAQRESLEGMLLDVRGTYTVTNNYTTDRFGDIGLVDGTKPLDSPTNVVSPGAEAAALQASNQARLITLDDGADVDRFTADKDVDLPWLTKDNQVRVGDTATVTEPVVLDFRRSLWRLQPTGRMVAGQETATFSGSRPARPVDVGGGVKIGTFNVLNYFTLTGEAYDAQPGTTCEFFRDRAGTPIAVDDCGPGPRGAATDASLARQQAKIVTAINRLGADVVSLEEVENSATLGRPRDTALSALVEALNAEAGAGTWAFVPSPAQVPTGEDVIRTAFIYQPAAVQTVGAPKILVGSSAFDNAREPLAQAFKVAGGSGASTFAVIVNHFKSKSPGSGLDADQKDGQSGSNASRKAQATALVSFADTFAQDAGTDRLFLTGDFNSYDKEDPVDIIEKAGFVNITAQKTDKETYQFEGQVGSLDHVFASPAAYSDVTGADVWNINAYESPGREYSRYNYNSVDLFDGTTPFRASDHDPEIIGFDAEQGESTSTAIDTRRSIRDGEDLTVKVSVTGDGTTPTGPVTVSDDGRVLASGELTAGAATLTVRGLGIGTHELTVAYAGDATHASSSASATTTVLRAVAGLTASVTPGTYGRGALLTVTGAPGAAGVVYVEAGGQLVGMGLMSAGTATISLSSTLPVGTTPLTVHYAGSQSFDPTSTTTSVTVGKAATVTRKIAIKPSTIVRGRTKPFVTVSVKGSGFVVDGGTVTVRAGGRTSTGTVRDGKARVRLGTFSTSGPRKKVTVTYAGNAVAEGSSTSFTVKVRRR